MDVWPITDYFKQHHCSLASLLTLLFVFQRQLFVFVWPPEKSVLLYTQRLFFGAPRHCYALSLALLQILCWFFFPFQIFCFYW